MHLPRHIYPLVGIAQICTHSLSCHLTAVLVANEDLLIQQPQFETPTKKCSFKLFYEALCLKDRRNGFLASKSSIFRAFALMAGEKRTSKGFFFKRKLMKIQTLFS